jgi:hypothetical protein
MAISFRCQLERMDNCKAIMPAHIPKPKQGWPINKDLFDVGDSNVLPIIESGLPNKP